MKLKYCKQNGRCWKRATAKETKCLSFPTLSCCPLNHPIPSWSSKASDLSSSKNTLSSLRITSVPEVHLSVSFFLSYPFTYILWGHWLFNPSKWQYIILLVTVARMQNKWGMRMLKEKKGIVWKTQKKLKGKDIHFLPHHKGAMDLL